MDNPEKQKNKSYKKQISIVIVCLSILLFIFTTFEFVMPIKSFLLGTFGVMIYPTLLFAILFCGAIASGRKFVYSPKYVLYLFLCFFFFMCVIHTIFTGFYHGNLTYGQYLMASFNTLYTPGGLVISLFTFPLISLLHTIAGIVIYAIAFVISLYFVLSYLEGVKTKKPTIVQERVESKFNADIVSNVETQPEQELEDEELYEEVPTIQTPEEEEDIFIKTDEETQERNDAKIKLGLKKEEETFEEPKEEVINNPSTKLDRLLDETYLNRSVQDKPPKVVFGESVTQTNKKNNDKMFEENKRYLDTICKPNYDDTNPIINGADLNDFNAKMQQYNARNSQAIKRDIELNINQTLVADEHQKDKVENQFYTNNQEEKSSENFVAEKKQFNNFGIEPLISPLNPKSFDFVEPNLPKFEEDIEDNSVSTELFKREEETTFDTTKLSLGDVSNSLGKSYSIDGPKPEAFNPFKADDFGTTSNFETKNSSLRTFNLPKNLMQNNASTTSNVEEEGDTSAHKTEPNLRFDEKYNRPPLDLLETYVNEEDLTTNHERNIEVLERVLEEFKIPAKVEAVRRGASVTRYELHMPTGIPVRKIHAHASDIALALASKGEVRIETPIRGKSAVGIEVPNAKIDKVGLKDIISSKEFVENKSPLSFALGKNVDGDVYLCNLQKMPHLLVAGSTGSGKSVCLNALILSLIYRTSPEDLRLILVDPKRVEFGIYNNLPHLLMPKVITEPKKALNAFDWLINEMERRYMAFQDCFVKDIKEYNAQPDVVSKKWQKLPYIVLIVDELADLVVTTNKKELEERIIRLTQKARAAGIHVILATQRPSVDIITGSIKINLPARIAFAVTNFVDSKTILDQGGAEKLLGRGDMLYSPSDGEPMRVQGAFVDTPEVRRVVDYIKEHNKSYYDDKVTSIINSEGGSNGGGVGATATVGGSAGEEFDSLMPDALKLVIENGQASISMLQRRFSIGFSRAARIIDQMELAKFISSSDGSKPRTVFITMEDYNQIYGN